MVKGKWIPGGGQMSFSMVDRFLPFPPFVQRGGIEIFLLLLAVIVSFHLYWFTIENPVVKSRFYDRFGREKGSLYFFIFNKLWGSLLFGPVCITAALVLLSGYGLLDFVVRFTVPGVSLRLTLVWSISLIPLLVLLSWLRSRR